MHQVLQQNGSERATHGKCGYQIEDKSHSRPLLSFELVNGDVV
jgi:hypothetical protein